MKKSIIALLALICSFMVYADEPYMIPKNPQPPKPLYKMLTPKPQCRENTKQPLIIIYVHGNVIINSDKKPDGKFKKHQPKPQDKDIKMLPKEHKPESKCGDK